MKFLHISTGDNRGAFSGAYRLHRNLIECGHESFMFVGNKTVDDPTVMAPARLFQRTRFFLEKIFSQVAKRIFGIDVQVSRIFKSNIGFVPTFEALRKIKTIKPDLVIVYYIADFLSEHQLLEIQRITGSPVAFYLMDMGMLTGSCHYAWSCKGYQSDCSDCPMTKSWMIKKMIFTKWKSRQVNYDRIRPIIVSGSEQLSEQVKLSSLTRSLDLQKILMGVNSETYNPENRNAARKYFSFTKDDIVLYFGAQNVEDKRKGFSYLVAALKILNESLSKEELARVCLFTIGSGDPIKKHNFSFKHIHLPFISDQTLFSKTYAAADVFICPSVEDSGPMMVNESMMSGTPVVAFDLGVAKDLVISGKTGYKLPEINSSELASALATFVRLSDEERARMKKNCRDVAIRSCSMEQQVQSFVALAEKHGSKWAT